jgi:DNA-binding response OmpR family regulator
MGMRDEDTQIGVGGLSIDVNTGIESRSGKAIRLTPLEFGLLVYLAHKKGRVVSPSELLEAILGASRRKGDTVGQSQTPHQAPP